MAAIVQFLKAGTATWTVPAGVASVKVECLGGGGSGNRRDAAGSSGAYQVGGGGGEYRSGTFSVTTGETINVQVGTGGASPAAVADGNPGGNTWFRSAATIQAIGGGGGIGSSGATAGTGGTGGNVNFNGGSSPLPNSTGPSGGGGSAGPNGAGANGGNGNASYAGGGGGANGGSAGGTATSGASGSGGNGRGGSGGGAASSAAGVAAASGVDGGGGAGNSSATANSRGGNGGQDTIWIASDGTTAGPCGGGGGQRNASAAGLIGGTGGLYGGGGGGGRQGSAGGDGLMVLTYESTAVSGTSTNTLGSVTLAATAMALLVAQASPVMGSVTVSSTAMVPVQATSSTTIGGLTSSGTAQGALQAAAAHTLGNVTTDATATALVRADAVATLGAITSAAAARTIVRGDAAATLGTVVASGTADAVNKAVAALALDAFTLDSTVRNGLKAVIDLSFDAVTAEAASVVRIGASVDTYLGDIGSAGGIEVVDSRSPATSFSLDRRLGAITVSARYGKKLLPTDDGKSEQRRIDEDLVYSLDQVRTLLSAIGLYIRGLKVGALPDRDARMIGEVNQRVRAAREYAGMTIKRLMARLDPYDDIYTFKPAEPIVVTPFGIVPQTSGFCNYQDNTTVQNIVAKVMTVIVNNREIVMEVQKPTDISTFFRENRIRIEEGDAVAIRVQLAVTPTDPNDIASVCEVGLTVNDRQLIFPESFVLEGYGEQVVLSYATTAYAGPAWAEHGAAIVVKTDGPVRVTSRTLLVTRLHKARGQ